MLGNRALLVEGNNDKEVLKRLISHHKVNLHADSIIAKGGIQEIIEGLRNEVEVEREALGIIIDADDKEAQANWNAVSARLRKAGYSNVPNKPDVAGTIVEWQHGDREDLCPKVGIWIMPDNQVPGMLENYMAFLVPDKDNDALWQLAGKCLQEAQQISAKIPTAKGHIYTYLAWQEDSGRPLGININKKIFDIGLPYTALLINWLNRLFN